MAVQNSLPVARAVAGALPLDDEGPSNHRSAAAEIYSELTTVAQEAATARSEGTHLLAAIEAPDRFPALAAFHQSLRDALLLEVPKDLFGWLSTRNDETPSSSPAASVPDLHEQLFLTVHSHDQLDEPGSTRAREEQVALAELLLFESVRLRLLIAMWSSEDFESLGGEERDIDAIAHDEVTHLAAQPELAADGIRPLAVMVASASVVMNHDARLRATLLESATSETREQLRLRAKIKSALRELRLPESVLLENAFSNVLDEERIELNDLQRQRPIALSGMTRQTMDQRVSRGRRAIQRDRKYWPDRNDPSLFDLMRTPAGESH